MWFLAFETGFRDKYGGLCNFGPEKPSNVVSRDEWFLWCNQTDKNAKNGQLAHETSESIKEFIATSL